MTSRAPPETAEGWYVLHDLRRIDWDAWRDADEEARERAIEEGREFLAAAADLDVLDADGAERDAAAEAEADAAAEAEAEGASATYAVLGQEADLLLLHLRPTLEALDAIERRFEHTALAAFTERAESYVSVTEASGYTAAQDFFDPDAEADPGIRNYIHSRLYPDLPDAEFVSFYPMSKRRGPEHNWYDLPFEERAEHMSSHGEIGRDYAGKVTQIVSGSIGFEDHEWGVTLFADDMTDVKDLLYEMRFDPSTSRFAEFGPFYAGRRFPPSDLGAFLAGERVPTGDAAAGGPGAGEGGAEAALDDRLEALGADVPEAGHAVVVESTADVDALREEVDGLRGNFEHYDTHLGTSVHEVPDGDGDAGADTDGDVAADADGAAGEDADASAAVVSLWETASAADTASGFLAELEGATDTAVGPVGTAAADADAGASETDAGSADGAAEPPHAKRDGGAVATTDDDLRATLAEQGVYGGQPHGEDVYALVLYSGAERDDLTAEVEDLADGFDRYDTHQGTTVYEPVAVDGAAGNDGDGAAGSGDGGPGADAPLAVVSLWDTADAAETAADYLADLPDVVRRAGEGDGFGTMGMFYTVEPEHRADFVETFGEVGELLAGTDGHRETHLYASADDENELFIASQWDAREDATAFFRSDAFAETVEWGRDVLADRPRHVFLA